MDLKAAFLLLLNTLIVMQISVLVDGTESHSCCKYNNNWNQDCIGFKWNNSSCIIIDKCETDGSNQCPTRCFLLQDLCVSDCPISSFKDWNKPGYCTLCDQSCLSCYDKGPNQCKSCPQGSYLYQESRCVFQCPDRLIPYQGKCVQNCPAVLYNDTCMDTCPHGFYTERLNSTCKACDEECVLCFSGGSDSCIKCRHFSYGITCLSKCPDNAKYVDNMQCESSCPLYHYSNNTCTDNCPSDDFILEGKCVNKCPAGSYYTEKKICVTECPHFTVEHKCVQTCPRGMYILEKKCLQKCPLDYQFSSINFTCLKNCEKLKYEKQCLDKCPFDAMGIYNSTCVIICPSEFSVIDPITRQCVKSCAYFIDNGICTSMCPENTYINIKTKVCLSCDKECIRCTGPLTTDCVTCKQYVNDQSKHMCREECDEGYYSHGNTCFKLCNKSRDMGDEYNTNEAVFDCIVHCPAGEAVAHNSFSTYDSVIVFNKTVGRYFTSKTYFCTRQCANRYYAAEENNLKICVEKCPDETPYKQNGICSTYPTLNNLYLLVICCSSLLLILVITGCIYNEKKMGRFCFRKYERQNFNKLYKQYVAGKFN